MIDQHNNTTDFGFEQVSFAQKTRKVAEVFHAVAPRYDCMNDLMSLGIHRYWKRFTVGLGAIRPHHHVLDVASGTGDLALLMARKLSGLGRMVLSDINPSMLALGRDKLIQHGIGQAQYVMADAEQLPFPAQQFDLVTIAFGLRNVSNKEKALQEMHRIIKPGGKVIILEFSHIVLPWLKKIYDLYAFQCIPKLGKWVTKEEHSYQYLVESIERHPDQESLKMLMRSSGFERCQYINLTGGIVAVHRGYVS